MALFGRIASMTNRPLRLVLNIVATSIVLYLGASLWAWGNSHEKQPTPSAARALFIFWLILLVPWMLVGPLSGMAFDGGATAEAYVFFLVDYHLSSFSRADSAIQEVVSICSPSSCSELCRVLRLAAAA